MHLVSISAVSSDDVCRWTNFIRDPVGIPASRWAIYGMTKAVFEHVPVNAVPLDLFVLRPWSLNCILELLCGG